MTIAFAGPGKRLDNIDLPTIGKIIGVGEDAIHAILDVESAGSGFDAYKRPKMLFEPHIFYRLLRAKGDMTLLNRAVSLGLAYPRWGEKPYPSDSYPRFLQALSLAPDEAYQSASWGLGQIMGFNARLAGYSSAKEMVESFVKDEENHLRAMVRFIISAGLDDDLRALDKADTDSKLYAAARAFARGYNGAGFEKNGYHNKLVSSIKKWRKIKDTPIR